MKIAWPLHHLEYLRAANTLPRLERYDAFQDIAEICCRTYSAVSRQAYRMRMAEEEAEMKRKDDLEKNYVESQAAQSYKYKPHMIAATLPITRPITGPTKAQLMAGR